jgi:hypothetical protein
MKLKNPTAWDFQKAVPFIQNPPSFSQKAAFFLLYRGIVLLQYVIIFHNNKSRRKHVEKAAKTGFGV